jgi:hypothetical protein
MGIVRDAPDARRERSPLSRLKLHLRLIELDGLPYHVVTLRPGTKIAFSTNFFHQTWHIVSSQRGAQLLARLLWGLSYQRQRNTLLLVHGDHLLPTPFEAERSDPFVLAPAGFTRLTASALRALKARLSRLGPPTRTIRWQTFGLDAALRSWREDRADRRPPADEGSRLRWTENRRLWRQERMERLGGLICYSAPPAVLRQQALIVHRLEVRKGNLSREMDYHFLAEESSRDSWCDGEVQIFADYMDRVAAATEARQELVPNPNQPVLSETLQELVSRRRDRIKARRQSRRRRRVAEVS